MEIFHISFVLKLLKLQNTVWPFKGILSYCSIVDIQWIWTCKGPPRLFIQYVLTDKCFVWLFSDPPKITHIMNDSIVNDGDTVTLDCQADGYPLPTIRWIFVSNNSFVPRTFRITGKQEEGFYICIANNGVGNPATRDVYITVLRKSTDTFICLVILSNSTAKQRIILVRRLFSHLE